MRERITVTVSSSADPVVSVRVSRKRVSGVRRVLLWALYGLFGAFVAAVLMVFLRWWVAVPVGLLLAAAVLALPDYYPQSKR